MNTHAFRRVDLRDYHIGTASPVNKDELPQRELQLRYHEQRIRADLRAKKKKPKPIVPDKPIIPPGHKRCAKCEDILPINLFHVNNRAKSGHQSRCKFCASRGKREYYLRVKNKNLLTPAQKRNTIKA